jgi:alpha-1,6-mannosyltransferase
VGAGKAGCGAADECEAEPLDHDEQRQADAARRWGTVGSLLMAVGALGAGAAPLANPVQSVPILGVFARITTVSMACAYTGIFILLLCWLGLGRFTRLGRSRLLTRAYLIRTLVLWSLPLALAPPMFSRDVYSYLAQSEIASRGLDPYKFGPQEALGVADPLTRVVPNIWRDTPAPYGSLFLTLGRAVIGISGSNVVLGVLLQRVLAVGGIALIVWALPRLARRCNVRPASALWLGALNPLVLFHLVSGVHNEALMVGLMLAGFELALSRSMLIGAAVITLAAAVKWPALLALGFLGAVLARRWGGRLTHLARAALLLTLVSTVVMVAVTFVSGLGFGWFSASLSTPNKAPSWMAPTTALGRLGGGIGILFGLGNHTNSMLVVTQAIGLAMAGLICMRLLWVSFRGRLEPLAGLGVGLGAVALLGPALHPWYLLWASIPLAAASTNPRFRAAATVISMTVLVVGPLPTGADFNGRVYAVWQAIVAALVLLALLLVVARNRVLPGRRATQRATYASPP